MKTDEYKKINDLILKLIKLSILKHVSKYKRWDYGKDIDLSEFDSDVVNEFNLQIEHVTKGDMEGDDFDLRFRVEGELGKLLEKYEIAPFVNVVIPNLSYDECDFIRDESGLEFMRNCRLACGKYADDWNSSKFEQFNEELEKMFLFKLIVN